MRYYVDTCVWIDFVEGKKYAEDFFIGAINREHIVVISEMVFNEFVKHSFYSGINSTIVILDGMNLLRIIHASESQEIEAKTVSISRSLPYGDVLHAVLARDNHAILITRDKHFLSLNDICKIKLF